MVDGIIIGMVSGLVQSAFFAAVIVALVLIAKRIGGK